MVEMRKRIKGLEKRVEELGGAGKELERIDLKEGKERGRRIVEDKLMKIERKIKMREKEERKNNNKKDGATKWQKRNRRKREKGKCY